VLRGDDVNELRVELQEVLSEDLGEQYKDD